MGDQPDAAGRPDCQSGQCVSFRGPIDRADATFDQARKRFEAAWNHQNGDSPINDSAEVQRTAKALGAQSQQLFKIGTDLENIAAALADAQKSGAAEITTLEHQLSIAKGVFSVLSSDKDASSTFNGAAMQQIMQDQNRYADAVAHHLPGAVANDADLQQAATLKALVDVGVNNATHAEGLNGAQQATEAYNRKTSAYDSLVKGGGTVAGLAGKALPPPYNLIGTIGGPALGMGGDALKQDIIGAPPSSTMPADVQIPHMQDSTAYHQVLDGLAANHVPIGLSPPFFGADIPGNANGPMHIATYDECKANRGAGDNYQYNQALKGAPPRAMARERRCRRSGEPPRRPLTMSSAAGTLLATL